MKAVLKHTYGTSCALVTASLIASTAHPWKLGLLTYFGTLNVICPEDGCRVDEWMPQARDYTARTLLAGVGLGLIARALPLDQIATPIADFYEAVSAKWPALARLESIGTVVSTASTYIDRAFDEGVKIVSRVTPVAQIAGGFYVIYTVAPE